MTIPESDLAQMERVVEAAEAWRQERIRAQGKMRGTWTQSYWDAEEHFWQSLAAYEEVTPDYRRSPQYAEGKKAHKALLSLGRDKDTLPVGDDEEVTG